MYAVVHKTPESKGATEATVILPPPVITKGDILRLIRELRGLQDFLQQAAIRKTSPSELPRTSTLLQKVADENKLNVLEQDKAAHLLESLEQLGKQAPVIHISFAADPSPKFLSRIADWFRQEVHPHTLLQIGLQPSIAGGCIVRTRSKYFDLSLRKYLNEHHSVLIEKIQGAEKT